MAELSVASNAEIIAELVSRGSFLGAVVSATADPVSGQDIVSVSRTASLADNRLAAMLEDAAVRSEATPATAVEPFSPDDIAGLATWLRAEASQVFTDVGLTTPAADGQDVAGWKARTGFNAVEATNKPVYNADGGPSGAPSIDFTGANNDRLAAGVAADWTFLHNGAGCTFYFVAKIATGLNVPILDTGAISTSPGVLAFIDDSANGGRLTFSIRNASTGIVNLQSSAAYNLWPDGEWHVGCMSYAEGVAPNEARVWIDGAYVLGGNTTGAPAAGAPNGPLTLGYSLPSGAIKLTGAVAEVLVYQGVHTESQMRQVLNYLADRHGLHTIRVDCLGHSIMEADGANSGAQGLDHGVPITESIPDRLALLLGPRYRVRNKAWNGANIATGGPNTDVEEAWGFNDGPPAQGANICVFWMGINDVIGGIVEATINSAFDARMTAALAAGTNRRVIVINISPFGNASGWTAPRQTTAENVNAHMASFVASNPTTARLIDAYSLLGVPAAPTKMLAAYDPGDGLHLSNYGLQFMAEKVALAVKSFGLG